MEWYENSPKPASTSVVLQPVHLHHPHQVKMKKRGVYSMYTGVTFHTFQIVVGNLAINLTVDDHDKRLGLLEERFVILENKIDLEMMKRVQPQQHTPAIQLPNSYSSSNKIPEATPNTGRLPSSAINKSKLQPVEVVLKNNAELVGRGENEDLGIDTGKRVLLW